MKKVSNFNDFINETNLTLQELGKLKDGEHRGNVLVNKLVNQEPITLSNNQEVEITQMKDEEGWEEPKEVVTNLTNDEGKWDVDKAKDYLTKGTRYLPVFKDKKGNEIKLNQFKKTSEFGSKGAGRLLSQFESIQLIFIGIKQMFPNQILTQTNLKRLYTDYKKRGDDLIFLPKDISIDSPMIDFFLKDRDWTLTFSKIPNRLWSNTNNFIDRNKKYKIIHSSCKDVSVIGLLYRKYRELAKEGGWSDINFAKFCPADVFLSSVEDEMRIKAIVGGCDNIQKLVKVLNYFFDRKQFVPISLKKISQNHPFTIIVNREKGKQLPEFYVRSFMINQDDFKGIGSKISTTSIWKHRNDKNVDKKDRKINFDSSDTSRPQNVDGEVEGSTSRHGKVSFNAIKRIIDSYTGFELEKLQDYKELRLLTVEELEEKITETILKIKDLNMSNEDESDIVSIVPAKRASDISGKENKLISKLQSLQIVLALMQLYVVDNEIANGAITKIMRYALSIENDKFETPRYLRII